MDITSYWLGVGDTKFSFHCAILPWLSIVAYTIQFRRRFGIMASICFHSLKDQTKSYFVTHSAEREKEQLILHSAMSQDSIKQYLSAVVKVSGRPGSQAQPSAPI